ncbi:MAG TPA: M4 family metallopeptidase, partial [Vicinamibacteria bacterium]|nr:M4 family metallopeptidase [Vicinamibacteria bacterium]
MSSKDNVGRGSARALVALGAVLLCTLGAQARAQEPRSEAAIRAMSLATGADIQVTRSTRTGLATFLSAPRGRSIPVPDRLAPAPADRAASFVASYGEAFGLRGRDDVRIGRVNRDALGMDHVRMRQVRSGIPVAGGELVVHLRGDRVLAANGKTLDDLDSVSLDPTVTALDALSAARSFVTRKFNAPDARFGEPRLEILNQALLGGRDFPTRLAWFVEASGPRLRQFIWIDARSRMVLLDFSQLTDAKNRSVYNGNGASALPGTLMRSEGGGLTGNSDADKAYDYAGDTYDFYFTNFGRDSFDNAGGQIVSTINYCEGACPYDNAFWNGSQMVYGAGFPQADDVVAHELTHAVTERTANLFYYMQSGALNESFSDIFGESVDLSNGNSEPGGSRWLVGEELVAGGVRNMMTPTLKGDPGKMSDSQFRCDIDPAGEDAGGVHTNSGVPNHAYALMVDGGGYNSITVTGIGLTKAAKIQYRALTQYLTSASDFLDNYVALQQACTDLIGTAGITAGNCAEVSKALNAVQMANTWPCSPTQATPPALCPAGQAPANLFFDSFESGLGNWTISEPASPNPPTKGWWSRTSDPNNVLGGAAYATTGVDSLWGYDRDAVADARIALAANLPTIPSGALLQFNHSYGFDSGVSINYDGGIVEYSTNAEAFDQLAPPLVLNST